MASVKSFPRNGANADNTVTPQPGGQLRTTGAMTERQRRFAAKNHNLIYRYLHEKGWEVSEYYDIAAFGYLRAVRRYLTEPGLSIYAFSSIAWQAMTQSIASFLRAEARRKDAEQRYIREAVSAVQDPFAELEARLLLHDLATVSSKQQYALAEMRLQGYSIAEIALAQGMPKIRIRRLLRELYRTYLQLYMAGEAAACAEDRRRNGFS